MVAALSPIQKINSAALALILEANEPQRGLRRVTKGATLEVVRRSFVSTEGETFSVRKHQALSDVSQYIGLAQRDRVSSYIAKNTDLLPVSHPSSSRMHNLSIDSLDRARARWVADDPIIVGDETRGFVVTALFASVSSPEARYAVARLKSLPPGSIPSVVLVAISEEESLEPLLAWGIPGVNVSRRIRKRIFRGGNSRVARSARARVQRRDRRGRFAYMGAGLSFLLSAFKSRGGGGGSSVSRRRGRVVGQSPSSNTFDVELSPGEVVRVPANKADAVKAVLSEDLTRGGGDAPVRVSAADKVVSPQEMEKIDAPSGFKQDTTWSPDEGDVRYYGRNTDNGTLYTDDAYDVLQFKTGNAQAKDNFEIAEQKRDEGQDIVVLGGGEGGTVDESAPVFLVQRRDGQGQVFGVAQSWTDVQRFISQDQQLFERDQPVNPSSLEKWESDNPEGESLADLPDEDDAGDEDDTSETPEASKTSGAPSGLKSSVSAEEIQATKEQSLADYVSEQGRFPLPRNATNNFQEETSDVAQAAKRDYQKVYDLLKEQDPALGDKYPEMDDFWGAVKEYSANEKFRAYDSVDEIPDEVKQFNRGYAEAVLGMDPDGEVTLYRNTINKSSNVVQAGTGYWSTDKEYAQDYGATPENIAESKQDGSFLGFYEGRFRPDQIGGMLGYSRTEDEFALVVGPDVAGEEGRISRLGPIEPPELPDWLDPENKLDSEKRTGGSAFRQFALAGALDLKKVDNNPMGDGKLADFFEANSITKDDWAAKYDALWGEGAYAEAGASGNNPSFGDLQKSFVQGEDGKWFLDVANIDAAQPDSLNNPYYGEGNPENFKNDKFDAKMKMLGLVQDITGDEFMSVKESGGSGSRSEAPQARIPEAPEPEADGGGSGQEPPDGVSAPAADAPRDDGMYEVNRGDYVPQGGGDGVESEDYTDDPPELAQRFDSEELESALIESVRNGTGEALLPFEGGDESVPAEAIHNALKEQGEDSDDLLDKIYSSEDLSEVERPDAVALPDTDEVETSEPLSLEEISENREALDEQLPELLRGLTNEEIAQMFEDENYTQYLPENEEFDVPEGMYEMSSEPFLLDGGLAPEGAPDGSPDNPIDLALDMSSDDLESMLRQALTGSEDFRLGYSAVVMSDGDGEPFQYEVPAEAIRDALQLQGLDTNDIIRETYQGSELTPDETRDMLDGEDVGPATDDELEETEDGGDEGDTGGPGVDGEALPTEDGVDGRGDRDGESPWSSLDSQVPESAIAESLREQGYPTPEIYELNSEQDAETFVDMMEGLKENNKYASSVFVYDVEEYREMRLFATADGTAGFGIKPNGDIVSVYIYGNSPHRGSTVSMLSQAVEMGGDRLDAYDTILPEIYARAGFRPISRVRWDDGEAPDGWDKPLYSKYGPGGNGEPDVVAMAYDPDRVGSEYDRTEGEYFDDYMEAMSARDAFLDGDSSVSGEPGQQEEVAPDGRTPESILREIGVPEDPGTVDIPEGAVRLFHYTKTEAIDKIKKDGLVAQEDGPAARDQEPAMIWAQQDEPVGGRDQFDLKPVVEFQVPEETWNSGPFSGDALVESVSPNNIIAIHEPWHGWARKITKRHSAEEIANGVLNQYDTPGLRENQPFFAKAIDKFNELLNVESNRESETSPPELRPFGEEIQELDVSGDLGAQINDAVENQRELVFAYQGGGEAPTERLVRPIRLETNERTGNVNLLAVDDEGNFKKFTLSKMGNASEVEETRTDVSGEDIPGREFDIDTAELPEETKQVFTEAQSKVLDEIFESDDVDTADVEDFGEQNDVNDSVTSDVVEAVDTYDSEGEVASTTEEKAIADFTNEIKESLQNGDTEDSTISTLDDFSAALTDDENFDTDLIWGRVIEEFNGKPLENGHIVVSSTMHGDRRYDVLVRRDSMNSFHIYHRVTYPDGSTKIKEMGGLGWHSTKALFGRVRTQIFNSQNRPKTTINKNLKPENNKTLFADNPSPKQRDSFVAADGSVLRAGERIVVTKETHSKYGVGGEIIKAERRFNSDGYGYTDYVRVKYDDGANNWIVSQSVVPEGSAAAPTDVAEERRVPEPTSRLSSQGQSEELELNELQAAGIPDDILNSASLDIGGVEKLAVDLSRLLALLPNPQGDFVNPSRPDWRIQEGVQNLRKFARDLENKADILAAELGTDDVNNLPAADRVKYIEDITDRVFDFSRAAISFKSAADKEEGPRKSFYDDVAVRLYDLSEDLKKEAQSNLEDVEKLQKLAVKQRLPDGVIPSGETLNYENVEETVVKLLEKLPQGDQYARYNKGNRVNTPVYQSLGAYHLERFLNDVRANEGNITFTPLTQLNEAFEQFELSRDEASGILADLTSLREAMIDAQTFEGGRPFAAPGIEPVDAGAIKQRRIQDRDNLFAANSELSNLISEISADDDTILSEFQDEFDAFFDGEERPLAELSTRSRLALQKVVASNIKTNDSLSANLSKNMIDFIIGLDEEEKAYYPMRDSIGTEADSLKEMPNIENIFRLPQGEEIIDDNGNATGWVVTLSDGGGINQTVQLKNKDTKQLLWVKGETNESTALAEYVVSRINNIMGVPGAPVVEISEDDNSILFITQAGDTLGLVGGVSEFSNLYNGFSDRETTKQTFALLDVVRLGIIDASVNNDDRHGGNFLVGNIQQLGVQGTNESQRLIPIDHGYARAISNIRRAESVEDYLDSYLGEYGADGGQLSRTLIQSIGAERFTQLSFPIVRKLISDLQDEQLNNSFISNNAEAYEAIQTTIDRLTEYLNMTSLFEEIENQR